MNIKLGYVSIALNLVSASTSQTITATNLYKIDDENARTYRLNGILQSNLDNLFKVLKYNVSNKIHVYRITSKLVPLATHPLTKKWNYVNNFKDNLLKIGKYIKKNNLRISAHPDHYTVINAIDEEIFLKSQNDLIYHEKIFNAMGLDSGYKLVMHVGGAYGDKEKSIKRFIDGFKKIPNSIQKRIVLENDDKIYNAYDVLALCKELNIPMVLDVHHHNCNNDGRTIKPILKEIFNTWNEQAFPPKIHFSSPKNEKEFRSHADNINTSEFHKFLKIAKKFDTDFDVMLEAKNKDLALFNLIDELKEYKDINIVNNSEFEF